MSLKRVFILGAGFSKQAGMPSAAELTDLLRCRFKYKKEKAISWFDDLKHRLYGPCGYQNVSSTEVNFEQIFDLARSDFEHCLTRHEDEMANDIDAWLEDMKEAIINVIWEKQKQSHEKLDLISKFTINLKPEDTVLTFNYDTLVEDSLSTQQKPWSHGFALEKTDGIIILKMHGSIDWIITQKGKSEEFQGTLLFSDRSNPKRREFYELRRILPDHIADVVSDTAWNNTIGILNISELGSSKPPLPIVGYKLWSSATKVLKQAQEIYIVGFSLSRFDTLVRWHIGNTMYERTEKRNLPKQVTLIDRHARELELNFQSVFGPDISIKLLEQCAEDVDWKGLLSK